MKENGEPLLSDAKTKKEIKIKIMIKYTVCTYSHVHIYVSACVCESKSIALLFDANHSTKHENEIKFYETLFHKFCLSFPRFAFNFFSTSSCSYLFVAIVLRSRGKAV